MLKRMALILALVICMSTAAHALDLEQPGSIKILLSHKGEPVADGIFSLYHVASLQRDYTFAPTEEFSGWAGKLEDIDSPKLAADLAKDVRNRGLVGFAEPVGELGKVVFQDLLPGLYLIVQDMAAEDFYPVEPFLVSIPHQRGEEFVYDVDATPKLELKPLPGETTKPTQPIHPPTKPTEPSPDLPQTGQLNWPVPVLLTAGAALTLLGLYLRRREE